MSTRFKIAGVQMDVAFADKETNLKRIIKLTEAALREFRRTNDVTLIVAADRFRGRVAPPD